MRIGRLRLKATHKVGDDLFMSVNTGGRPVFEEDTDCKNFSGVSSETIIPSEDEDEKEYEIRARGWHEGQLRAKTCHIFMLEPNLYCFCDEQI